VTILRRNSNSDSFADLGAKLDMFRTLDFIGRTIQWLLCLTMIELPQKADWRPSEI
jgi:hypothetical protein